MKIAFWFVGASCAGKSKYAKLASERLETKWISLDTVEDKMKLNGMTREEGYNFIFNTKNETIVVDGIIPFNFPVDMGLVSKKLEQYNIIFVLVKPSYEQWLKNRESRKKENPNSHPEMMTEEVYENYYTILSSKLGRHILIEKEENFEVISQEQVRNLNYQHEGFTDVKFKQLAVPCKNRSVLDLGCSSCQYEQLFYEAGATKYQGLDVNLSYLIRKNAKLFDINNLEFWNEEFDVVVCSSVMHYIHDKEKFIRECARITKEVCVLEIPLDLGKGSELVLGSRGLYFPTQKLFEEWLSKYFMMFKCLGESIVEDGSYRLIYHCYK